MHTPPFKLLALDTHEMQLLSEVQQCTMMGKQCICFHSHKILEQAQTPVDTKNTLSIQVSQDAGHQPEFD